MQGQARVLAALAVLVTSALSGCITQGGEPLTLGRTASLDLRADGAEVLRTLDGLSLVWKGNAGFAMANPSPVGLPIGLPVGPGGLNDAQVFRFDLPRDVTKVDATLRWASGDVDLNLYVRNATGRTQCRSTGGTEDSRVAEHCYTWLVGPRADTERWSTLVGVASNLQGMSAPEPFTLTLNLTTAPWQLLGPALAPAQQSAKLAFRTLRVDETHKTGEPSLKLDDQGTVYIAAPTGPLQSLWVSRDHGRSFAWQDVAAGSTPPRIDRVQGGGGDSDIAVGADGKDVYFGDLWSCMSVASSHDSMRSWFNQPLACDVPGVDRQWLATTGPEHVWLVYNGRLGMTLEHSMDGGMTWPVQTHIMEDNCARGNLVVTPDGKDLYATGCNDQGLYLMHSQDMGLTYRWLPIVEGDRTGGKDWSFCNGCSIFQVVALDKAGNLYVVWSDPTSGEQDVWLSTSHDQGETWTKPFRVNKSPGTSVLPWVAAGEPGHVMVAWYQTKIAGNPNNVTGEWYLHAAEATDGLAGDPQFAEGLVAQVPVQYGNLCTTGSACPGGRNLLDFINVAFDHEGRAHLAFIDGSYGGSAGNSFVMYAQQTRGLATGNATASAPSPPVPREVA